MGQLIEGKWHQHDIPPSDGKFKRTSSQFRHWITTDGIKDGFKAEANRYHLYVSLACPWAHRTLIMHELKQLTSLIDVSVVHPNALENGWTFATDFEATTGDPLFGHQYLYQLYSQVDPQYTGRVTVPVLFDKQRNTIVSNESADIIRMFNNAFDHITDDQSDYYPQALQQDIDILNRFIYEKINNGVYKVGFAIHQTAYEEAILALFTSLDELEQRLQQGDPYLFGNTITETDWRLFTTLIRFDVVYVGHFKCNLKRIIDYPALAQYLKRLYDIPGIAATVDFSHIKQHYYYSHTQINPNQIVAKGPCVIF